MLPWIKLAKTWIFPIHPQGCKLLLFFFFFTLYALHQLMPQLLPLPSDWSVLGLVLWRLPPLTSWMRHKTRTNSYIVPIYLRPRLWGWGFSAGTCEDTSEDEKCTDKIDMTGPGGTVVFALMFVPLHGFPFQVDLYHTMVHQAEQTEYRVIRQSGAPLLKVKNSRYLQPSVTTGSEATSFSQWLFGRQAKWRKRM